MGYYSEIAIELVKNDYKKLKDCLIENKETWLLDAADIFEREMRDGETIVTLHWDSCEWYLDDIVDYVNEFLKSVPCHISIIGNYLDDVEELVRNNWVYGIEDVYIERKIVGWNEGRELEWTEN